VEDHISDSSRHGSKELEISPKREWTLMAADRQLKVKIGWEVGGDEFSPVLSLMDTGAEVCLVNKGLIPKRFPNQPSVVCT